MGKSFSIHQIWLAKSKHNDFTDTCHSGTA